MSGPPKMDLSARPRLLVKSARDTRKDILCGAVVVALFLYLIPWWLSYLLYFTITSIVLIGIVVPFVEDFRPRSQVRNNGKAVVITGCDSGFGYLLAKKLDQLGFLVFAGCLFPDGEGARILKETGSERLYIFGLDVTDDGSVKAAVKFVDNNIRDHVLWAVVCNAGINDGAEIHWTSFETIQRVIDINTFGVVRVTKAFLTHLIKSRGRLVAVASAAGRYTYPGMVPYCMSKHAVVSFCDGLRMEMSKFGVQVVTVEPWMYKTNITEKQTIKNYLSRAWESAPDDVKEIYPSGYMERYLKSASKFINISMANDPNDVVLCLQEAVIADRPKYSYQPGTVTSKVAFWFYRKLPKSLADVLIADACSVKS